MDTCANEGIHQADGDAKSVDLKGERISPDLQREGVSEFSQKRAPISVSFFPLFIIAQF